MTGLFLNSLLLTFLVEWLGRTSFADVLKFAAGSPLKFLCNICIIFATLSLSYLAGKRRLFFQALFSILWIILGTVNCVVLHYRMTPFSAEDFKLVTALTKILKNYVTPVSIVLLAAGTAATLALTVFLFLKIPKEKTHRSIRDIAVRIGAAALLLLLSLEIVDRTDALSDNFENLAEAYQDYGFAYCFCNSLIKSGISEPDVYSRSKMRKIASQLYKGLEEEAAKEEFFGEKKEIRPNILMIQLESFFDPYYLPSYQCSEDPIPFFRSLKESCPTGLLRVPVVGAGTVNSEFEVLTGMSTSYFGPGEYPYNTILQEMPAESLAYILSSQDYTSTVIHNNTGTFYSRDKVFSSLGFDCFVPSEYMYDLEYTPTNWATDEQLPDLMLKAMEQSGGSDFVYTITVQSHGRYPEEAILEDPQIRVRGPADANVNPMVYYAAQIREVDNMVRDLVEKLEKQDEPVLLVLFGDHLPSLGYEEEEVALPDLYETEYVIWSNYDTGLPRKRLDAEALSTVVLKAAGLQGGILPAFHRVFDRSSHYDEYLNLIEYDMLYGEGWIFEDCADLLPGSYAGKTVPPPSTSPETDGEKMISPYVPTELKFGLDPIIVDRVERKGDRLYVYGEGFNECSRISVDGKILDTVYEDHGTIYLDEDHTPKNIEDEAAVEVFQCDENLVPVGPAAEKRSSGQAS